MGEPGIADAALGKAALKVVRRRARAAIEGFVQAVLDHPDNAAEVAQRLADPQALERDLWREGLAVAGRLLFLAALERSTPAPGFTAAEAWRRHSSPSALLPAARVLRRSQSAASSRALERALRATFALFYEGSPELGIAPPLGASFAPAATALLDGLTWGDRATATLVDGLLSPLGREAGDEAGAALAAEDLGRVFEGLLDLEPGLATEPLCRLRHARLEVVVAERALGELAAPAGPAAPRRAAVRFVERIAPGRFYLRAGLGRKTTGAYYTPRALTEALVRETLSPVVAAETPDADPQPAAVLALRVLDPAMGSGHFLLEACRFLGRALLDACVRCRSLARDALERAEAAAREPERAALAARAEELLGRLAALPPLLRPVADLAATPGGRGEAERRCRRAVVACCLHGVDRNPIAVELARLTLWLEAHVDGAPLPALERRLRCGDSLTGPFLEHLARLPVSGRAVEPQLATALSARCDEALGRARDLALALERRAVGGGGGVPDDELEASLSEALRPLRTLAAAWAGAVMSGEASADDAYARLLDAVAGGGSLEGAVDGYARRLIEAGREGVAFELAFPEITRPAPGPGPITSGFDAVLGNPPWDKVLPLEREFFSSHDPRVLTAPTARERRPLYEALRRDPAVRAAWDAYAAPFAATRRFVEAAYRWQVASVDGAGGARRTIGHADRYRYFVERSWECLRPGGRLGMVLPNTLYNAEGSTGVRRLLLHRSSLERCVGFSNAKGIFEIGLGQRFCLIVARRGGPTTSFRARFGLDDVAALAGEREAEGGLLEIGLDLLARTSPQHLCFPEVSSAAELAALAALHGEGSRPLGEELRRRGIDLHQEMNMTTDSRRFASTAEVLAGLGLPARADPRLEPTRSALLARGWLVVHEKGTFHAFDDGLKSQPRYLCQAHRLLEGPGARPRALEASRYFRLVARATIHATELDKAVLCCIPPGAVVGNSALAESAPEGRPAAAALVAMALCNSRCFDLATRLRLGTNLNQFVLESLPVPTLPPWAEVLCAHLALLLTCRHEAYAPLWSEQTGRPGRFPALAGPEARLRARATLDAVVAHAWGLDRAGYAEVLQAGRASAVQATFAERCLAAYDDASRRGPEAFARAHDPLASLPLATALPTPAALAI